MIGRLEHRAAEQAQAEVVHVGVLVDRVLEAVTYRSARLAGIGHDAQPSVALWIACNYPFHPYWHLIADQLSLADSSR